MPEAERKLLIATSVSLLVMCLSYLYLLAVILVDDMHSEILLVCPTEF